MSNENYLLYRLIVKQYNIRGVSIWRSQTAISANLDCPSGRFQARRLITLRLAIFTGDGDFAQVYAQTQDHSQSLMASHQNLRVLLYR